MESNNESSKFSYTYSAKDQTEIKKIREKYVPREEDKMEQLRRLDRKVTQKPLIIALVLGIVGSIILGLGMSLSMSEFGEILGSHRDMATLIGIIIGAVGAIVITLAYPVYKIVFKRERKKLAPEILKLTDELMK